MRNLFVTLLLVVLVSFVAIKAQLCAGLVKCAYEGSSSLNEAGNDTQKLCNAINEGIKCIERNNADDCPNYNDTLQSARQQFESQNCIVRNQFSGQRTLTYVKLGEVTLGDPVAKMSVLHTTTFSLQNGAAGYLSLSVISMLAALFIVLFL